jgi:hypothetical protein
MKTLNVLGIISSAICVLMSIAMHDYTEAAAWGLVVLYNLRDLIYEL